MNMRVMEMDIGSRGLVSSGIPVPSVADVLVRC